MTFNHLKMIPKGKFSQFCPHCKHLLQLVALGFWQRLPGRTSRNAPQTQGAIGDFLDQNWDSERAAPSP